MQVGQIIEGQVGQINKGQVGQINEGQVGQMNEGQVGQINQGQVGQINEGQLGQINEGQVGQIVEEQVGQKITCTSAGSEGSAEKTQGESRKRTQTQVTGEAEVSHIKHHVVWVNINKMMVWHPLELCSLPHKMISNMRVINTT